MHNTLEDYLVEVRSCLRGLPPKRRELEIGELREHLESYFEGQEQLGLAPDAAAAATIEQFGEPGVVGNDLVRAWRRGRLNSLPVTALAAYMLQNCVLFLIAIIVRMFDPEFAATHLMHIDRQAEVVLIAGLVMGYAAPRYGTFAAVFPTLINPFTWIANDISWRLSEEISCLIHPGSSYTITYYWPGILSDVLHIPEYAAIAFIAAIIGKRLAERRRRLRIGV